MFIGAICYSVWIWGFLIPCLYRDEKKQHGGQDPDEWYLDINLVRTVLVLTALINGVGAALLFVSQGLLISETACHENKGFYNGFYLSVFMASGFTGNQVSVKLVEALDANEIPSRTYLFTGFGIVAMVGSFLFCCLNRPSISEIEGDLDKEDAGADC